MASCISEGLLVNIMWSALRSRQQGGFDPNNKKGAGRWVAIAP